MTSADLYLVRHAAADDGESVDPGLSEQGRREARLLAARLSALTFGALLHSPKRRAAETAAILAASLTGVPMLASELLTDRTPIPSPARRSDYPEGLESWFEKIPGDERDEDGAALSGAFNSLNATALDLPRDGPVVMVTHAFVIGWFVRLVLEAPTRRWMDLVPNNTGLTVIRCGPKGPILLSYNDTGHL